MQIHKRPGGQAVRRDFRFMVEYLRWTRWTYGRDEGHITRTCDALVTEKTSEASCGIDMQFDVIPCLNFKADRAGEVE